MHTTCSYCGITSRWRRPDGRCAGCGKPFPRAIQTTSADTVSSPIAGSGIPDEAGPAQETITQRLLGKLFRTAMPREEQCGEESVPHRLLRMIAYVLVCPIAMVWWIFFWDDGKK